MNLKQITLTLVLALFITRGNAVETIPVAGCSISVVGVLVCVGVGTAVNETINALNGKEVGNKNGEIRKGLGAAVDAVKKMHVGGDGITGTIEKGVPHPNDRGGMAAYLRKI